MTKTRLLTSAFIFIFWASTTTVLIRDKFFSWNTSSLHSEITWEELLSFKEYWMGIYFGKEKIGYTHLAVSPVSQGDQGGLVVQSKTFMSLAMLGQDRLIEWESVTRVDPRMRPASFEFSIKSGPYVTKFAGTREEKGWRLRIGGPEGLLDERMIPGGEELFPAPAMGAFLALMKWGKHDSVKFSVYDPFSQSQVPVQIHVLSSKFEQREKKVKVYELETRMNDLSSKMWVTEAGEILREENPMGFVTLLEDRETAMKISRKGKRQDLARAFAIPAGATLPDPRQTRYLRLKWDGIPLKHFPIRDERQKILDEAQGLIEIRTVDPGEPLSLPLTEVSSFRSWLEATPFVQSGHPQIRKLAAEMIAGEKDSYQAAKKILREVHSRLQPAVSLSVPSSLDVLKQGRGDCNEFTVLFTALARAAGLPAKMVAGLIYMEGSFYYHAWPEVYVGKWIAMDPVFGQDAADATHIALVEGDLKEQIGLVALIGKLKIQILEHQ